MVSNLNSNLSAIPPTVNLIQESSDLVISGSLEDFLMPKVLTPTSPGAMTFSVPFGVNMRLILAFTQVVVGPGLYSDVG